MRTRLCLALLASVPLLALPGPALADHCETLRDARRLAHRHGLEDHTLRRLEAVYCGRSPARHGRQGRHGRHVPPGEHEDCHRLSVMAELAAAHGADSSLLDPIAAAHTAECQLPDVDGALRDWPGGRRARSHDGNRWWYPNGTRAYSHGTWYYPDGGRARSSSGTWYYPSGARARTASGTWYAPGGRRMRSASELVTWACTEAGPGVCRGTLAEAHFGPAEQQTAAVVRVAWLAAAVDRPTPVVVMPALPVGVLWGGDRR